MGGTQTYSGTARFTDDCGLQYDLVVELEALGFGDWVGILAGPVDWAALLGDRDTLLLELPDDTRAGFPRFSRVRVDLAIGDRAGANGIATVVEVLEDNRAQDRRRRRARRQRAIHWHATH